jgi:hypothetical protein
VDSHRCLIVVSVDLECVQLLEAEHFAESVLKGNPRLLEPLLLAGDDDPSAG